MAFTREVISKAISAITDFDRLPPETQTHLIKIVREKCEERTEHGLSELEALAHTLPTIKEQIHSLSAPHLPTRFYGRSPDIAMPITGFVNVLVYLYVALVVVPPFRDTFREARMTMLPNLTRICLAIADFSAVYWILPALLASSIAVMTILQFRSARFQRPWFSPGCCVLGMTLLFLTITTVTSVIVPLLKLHQR